MILIFVFLIKLSLCQKRDYVFFKNLEEKTYMTFNFGAEGVLPIFPKIGYYLSKPKPSTPFIVVDFAPIQAFTVSGTFGLTLGYKFDVIPSSFYVTIDHASNFNWFYFDISKTSPPEPYFTHNYKIGLGFGKMMLFKFGPSFAYKNKDVLDNLPKLKKEVYFSAEVILIM